MGGNLVHPATRRLTTVCGLVISVSAGAFHGLDAQTPRVATDNRANVSAELAQRITVDLDRAPLASAIERIATEAGLIPAFSAEILPKAAMVTVHLRQSTVMDAFLMALRGTGLTAVFPRPGYVSIVNDPATTVVTGIVTGRVIDAKTKAPIAGVTVSLDDAARGVQTGTDGTFKIAGVRDGAHTVRVRRIGYVRATRSVTVADGEVATVDVALEPSVSSLEQVVVTGTVIPTERKAVPNAITVITAKEIEQRNITHIDQLFRGDVPGVWAQAQGSNGQVVGQVTMASRGATSLTSALSQPIKTYVDGVELSDPSYLGLIDPKSIERIEILTGPQASTIYGSNALNGVMQIFTKRGSASGIGKPQLTASLQSGVIQNNFSSSLTPQHDYSAQVAGVDSHLSYNFGGSWTYVGPWTPGIRMSTVGGFGGARFQQGPLAIDASVRRTSGKNQIRGTSTQTLQLFQANGIFDVAPSVVTPHRSISDGQTFGTTVTYTPWSWWSHTLTVGSDQRTWTFNATGVGYSTIRDTLLDYTQSVTTRTSLSYTTTARVPMTSLAEAIITVGTDGWHSTETALAASNATTLTGSLTSPFASRIGSHNRGGFLQGQLGIRDALFVTYGLRAEWNPNYGKDANPNLAPRYGVAYAQAIGGVTAKLRASYGRATQPPTPDLTREVTIFEAFGSGTASAFGGSVPYQFANPDLLPQSQQGAEGGLELYFGNHASLTITRYNQTVNDLIMSAKVDSTPTVASLIDLGFSPSDFPQWTDGYGHLTQIQNLNLGSIRNQGWETQGTITTGPITLKGTYSWNKSRILGVTPRYRAQFPQYPPGSVFYQLPEHTWATDVTYARGRTTASVNIQGQGLLYQNPFDDALVFNNIASRLAFQRSARMSFPQAFVGRSPGYAIADLNVSQRMSAVLDGMLQIQNLTDFYQADPGVSYASIGRQTKVGLRVRW